MTPKMYRWLGVPEWLIHHAFFSTARRRFANLRVLQWYLDLHPNRQRALRRIRRSGQPLVGHVHVPKTGGSYTSSLPCTLEHVNFSHVVIRDSRDNLACPVGLVPISGSAVEGFFLWSNVRNPLRFLVNYYHWAKGFGPDPNTTHYDHVLAQRGFDYFLKTITSRDHKWPSRRFMFPNLFDHHDQCAVSWVNRLEQLDEDMAKLSMRFGARHEPGRRRNVSPREGQDEDYYSEELLALASETYSREMRLFGYDGFDMTEPAVELQPVERSRIRYDYRTDELHLDRDIVPRTERQAQQASDYQVRRGIAAGYGPVSKLPRQREVQD